MIRVADETVLEKIGIDAAEIELRKRLMGFRPEDAEILVQAAPFMEPVIQSLVKEFFLELIERNRLTHFSISAAAFDRLGRKLEDYLRSFFAGEYGIDYVRTRLDIGLIHQDRGVEPKLYISAMKSLENLLRRYISQYIPDKELGLATWNAIDALLCFDTLFVLDTYLFGYVSEIERARSQIEIYARSLEDKVAARTRELEEISRRDSLSGLYNHRAFSEFLKRDLALAVRNSSSLCLVYIDIDDFKLINDERGHHEGDQVIKYLGWVLSSVSRESDIPCRYGGDEFCVILPNAVAAQAKTYSDRVRAEFSRKYETVTLSVGIVQTGPSAHYDMDTLIKRADEAMYTAKRAGGNQTGSHQRNSR